MTKPTSWQFAVEVHPPAWRFPDKNSWIAGWIRPESGLPITDVRARIHDRIILGLSGLPHPAFSAPHERPDVFGPGFSLLLVPQPEATLLRLEARDRSGRWTEFFRTAISVAPETVPRPPAPRLHLAFSRLITALLKQRRLAPTRAWAESADDLVAAFIAEPLNAHPNLPFRGAMEEPLSLGRLRNGHIPVTGWLVHPTAKITRLLIVIDSLPGKILPFGPTRHDVTGVFPALDGQANAAFVGEIALPADFAAPVLLKLFAELANGETHLAFARRFTPQAHGDTGQMPPFVAGPTFARASWELYRSAGRHALSRHGLIRAAGAAWARYQALPAYRPGKIRPQMEGVSFLPLDGPAAIESESPTSTVISPADDMFVSDTPQYFHIGREALALVQQASTLAGGGRIEAILDLPCGYGRVARWLRTAYPAARLTVSDTQGAGVAFCIEQMGVAGVQASMDGSHWALLPGPYDMIWCGSLLTHFDREQWVSHLRRFAERLTPQGVLVFTSHGLRALDNLLSGKKDYGLPHAKVSRLCTATIAEGFGYADYPDSPGYGIAVAQTGWICELIARETELHVLYIREAAWGLHQDVVVCMRRPKPGRQ